MLSIRGLNKWLFSLALILSLSTVVSVTTYENISYNSVELVIDSNLDDVIHFYDVVKAESFKISNTAFNTQLVAICTSTTNQKIRIHNNQLLNEITNYQLSFLQLLTKTNVLTALG
ncbi:hypothetical protein U0L90_05665 [Flavobacteriaceae sp. LMIT009]